MECLRSSSRQATTIGWWNRSANTQLQIKCAWSHDLEAEVWTVFFKKCSDRFFDLLRTARENNVRPTWILDDLWVNLLEYWKSLEFEKKSRQGREARMSEKGSSMHTGGSISMETHRRRLAKGRPVTHDEVFEETHMKKLKDGTKITWVETRAETTHFIQSQPTDDQGRSIQPTQEKFMDMWIKAAGGVHKGRAYGLGSEFSLNHLTSELCGSYSSSHCSIDVDEFEQLNRKWRTLLSCICKKVLQGRKRRSGGKKKIREEKKNKGNGRKK
ncbi:uncharacterized protein LOC142166395 isoform X2 [Nicotiana tabacum]|uniref:Uncharacterized protein LOC142166395 isoform X2 n=1 Tax=Nicotiana tabacum TaxID=4097 RepID=A0AC58S9K2_TOBAC